MRNGEKITLQIPNLGVAGSNPAGDANYFNEFDNLVFGKIHMG